jgi:hypothetical protein
MRLAFIATVLALALPSMAAATVYECAAQQRNYASDVFSPFTNPIQPRITITVDEASGTATVSDALIQGMAGRPIPGNVTENSGQKLTVIWELPIVGFGGVQTTMSFRAAFIKTNKKLIVTATPQGYTGRFFARGSCVTTG